ncbi:lasso peptide biosynthesis B2 protein [Labrys sp. 22185]|uniref:lasso peptide biosynthesis B2 protein n=1 Tax=Labrys sp. 22185 TaxID=3453888 RepID=UPI003F876ED5
MATWAPSGSPRLRLSRRLRLVMNMLRVNRLQKSRQMDQLLQWSNPPLGRPNKNYHPKEYAASVMREILTLAPLTFRDLHCLGAAISLTREMRLAGYAADIQIGVRRFPFEAHAWSTLDGQVLVEDPRLPSQLDIIFGGT